MRLVTVEQMRALERRTFAQGASEAQLMEQAGPAVGRAAAEWLANPRGRTLLVLAGKGNNGGDALIAARLLARASGMAPRVYLAAERADDPLLDWVCEDGAPVAVHGRGQPLRAWLREADVVLDGLLGIGVRLPLRGAVAEILAVCAEERPPGQRRIAVDVPSGVDADTGQADAHAFRADLTLSTGPAKPGHFVHPGAACAGRVRALDIGLAREPTEGGDPSGVRIERVEAAEVARLLPARPDDSHKGTFGKALIVAGSRRYVGAAYLAGAAAVRAGAGLVTLALPSTAQAAVAGRSVETTFLPLVEDPEAPGTLTAGHLGAILEAARTYDAVAIGPGLGDDPATRRLVVLLLEQLAHDEDAPPVVIDADGLNALAAVPDGGWARPAQARWVLTPHPGEMSRLTGRPTQEVQTDRIGIAREHAGKWGQVVVLKGAPSVAAAPGGRVALSGFANAALATAGAGDVLTGATTALLAQGCPPRDAAVAACFVHGLAAELWRHRHGAAGLAVSNLAELLPDAMGFVRRQL